MERVGPLLSRARQLGMEKNYAEQANMLMRLSGLLSTIPDSEPAVRWLSTKCCEQTTMTFQKLLQMQNQDYLHPGGHLNVVPDDVFSASELTKMESLQHLLQKRDELDINATFGDPNGSSRVSSHFPLTVESTNQNVYAKKRPEEEKRRFGTGLDCNPRSNKRKKENSFSSISSSYGEEQHASTSNFKSNYTRRRQLHNQHEEAEERRSDFMSGTEKYRVDQMMKNNKMARARNGASGYRRKRLGGKRRFKPPSRLGEEPENGGDPPGQFNAINATNAPSFVKKALAGPGNGGEEGEQIPEELKGIDPKLVEAITNEMMDRNPGVRWDDIAGLEFAKKCVQEIVVWPMLRPDLFKGLRGPPKGLLLFGPPGTGKTLIGKAIASESNAKFFSISASSLTSKWHGEGEKMVRALFAVARHNQPSVIFVDEIDSLLSQRNEGEFEASRRIKTEFLVQLDGAATSSSDRILLVGATNRPQELDEAARRRMVKRLYIPLPNKSARRELLLKLIKKEKYELSEEEIKNIVERTKGYSGADLHALATEAAMGPMRDIRDIRNVNDGDVRPINNSDFANGLNQVRASVHESELEHYIKWNTMYGSFEMQQSA